MSGSRHDIVKIPPPAYVPGDPVTARGRAEYWALRAEEALVGYEGLELVRACTGIAQVWAALVTPATPGPGVSPSTAP